MKRRMDLVTLNYVVRIVAVVLAVILNAFLISDAINYKGPVDRAKVIWLAVGAILSTAGAAWMILNPPE